MTFRLECRDDNSFCCELWLLITYNISKLRGGPHPWVFGGLLSNQNKNQIQSLHFWKSSFTFVMLLYFFITCLSLLFFKSLLLPPWASELILLFSSRIKTIVSVASFSQTLSARSMYWPMSIALRSRKTSVVECNNEIEIEQASCLLDLPELVLECILERLPPESLFRIRGVCTSMRKRCVSDHLWEKHMKNRWGRVIGPAAYREWQWQSMSNQKQSMNPNQLVKMQKPAGKGLMRILSLSLSWPLSWIRSSRDSVEFIKNRRRTCFPSHKYENSVMSWYLALQTGKFWFPAQVYNRENGHVGFVLSCYDAELSYDPITNTFQARYPPHGRRAIAVENYVPWERVRAPSIDTPPHDLHISDCLNDLRPGDHIEIQWRRNKEFPFGWWYGVVGHLETCHGNETYCLCHSNDNVVLEFNQYARGSRWRCTLISRKNHRERGNEVDGFYGGIHKICKTEEISTWKRLWPTEVLE